MHAKEWHRVNKDWTIGPLDHFLDYFLDHFLDQFLDLFFGPFFKDNLSGGRQTVGTKGGAGCNLSVLREVR